MKTIHRCVTSGGVQYDEDQIGPFEDDSIKEIKGNAIFLNTLAGSAQEASTICAKTGRGTMAKKQYQADWNNYWKDVNPREMQTCDIGDAWWSGDYAKVGTQQPATPGTFIPPHLSPDPVSGTKKLRE